MIRVLSAGMARAAGACLTVASVMLALMVVLLVVEVAGRYVLGFSTLVADEFGGYLFVGLTFLGFAQALRAGQFLNVDLAVRRLPPGLRRWFDAAAGVAGAFVCGVGAWASWQTVSISIRFGSTSPQVSETPLWLPQIVMPFGMALLGLGFLELALRALAGLPPPESPDEGGFVE